MSRRIRIAVLAFIGLLALVGLASGLRDVSFKGGQAMGVQEAQTVSQPMVQIINSLEGMPLWKALLIWAIIFLVFVLLSLLLSPALRRQVVRIFFRLSLMGLVLFLFIRYFRDAFLNAQMPEAGAVVAQPSNAEDVIIPVFQPPTVSPWLSFAVSVGVLVALIVLAWGLNRWWERRKKFLSMQRPLEDIAHIARTSLEDLSAGVAWDDVILESYDRMSRAVENRRGLARAGNMTPSEFAAQLERAGLPGDAVRRLTRLFERVRYGARTSTQNEINEARQCLTAILHYCGETA